MSTALAHENDELKRERARSAEELAQRIAMYAELAELAKRLARDNELLKDKLYRLMRQRYGPKADRFPEGQLALYDELFGEEEQEEPRRACRRLAVDRESRDRGFRPLRRPAPIPTTVTPSRRRPQWTTCRAARCRSASEPSRCSRGTSAPKPSRDG